MVTLKNGPFLIKLNRQLLYNPEIVYVSIYPRAMKTYVHKNLYVNVHRSFLCNRQRLETTQIAFNG